MNRASTSIEHRREARARHVRGCALAIALAIVSAAAAAPAEEIPRSPAPDGARVYFIDLQDGGGVTSPLLVRFGLAGMGVAPAGIQKENTGHHHLLIDTELANPGLPVPSDENHRHFGGGQTEISIDLAPGKHTLQLVLADHLHVPHQPPVVSEQISVTVE